MAVSGALDFGVASARSGQEWPENAALIWSDYVPADIRDLYEVRDYHHAAAILVNEFPKEAAELFAALRKFRITTKEILAPGGNESGIPKKIAALLRPGWAEEKLEASLVVGGKPRKTDTHKIDFVNGRVAFDLEWNSKDQTFDRDLYAFRTFFEFDNISLAVLLTRSTDRLNVVFRKLGKDVMAKYGASTTHMEKLVPRLEAGRAGGCPVLVFGITETVISDYKP